MAYHNPQDSYGDYTHYPPAQPYQDNPNPDFNAYDTRQPYRPYEQGGYVNDGYGAYADEPPIPPTKEVVDRGLYDGDDIPSKPTGPKTAASMRQWRSDYQGNLWTKGSRTRCFGRFFCCTIMIAVFLFVAIVLSLVLWIKPPSVIIGQPALIQSNNAVNVASGGLTVDLGVAVSVNNPNYFSVEFTKIEASLFYPPNNTAVGGGQVNNIDFKSNQDTKFTMPITLQYNISSDPNHAVLISLADKCGIVPGTSASNIQVDYTLNLGIKVLSIPINPTISGSFDFACPISSSDISNLLNEAGLNVGSLAGLLSGLTSK